MNFQNQNLRDVDINDNFLQNLKLDTNNITIDFSYNELTEYSMIKILQHLYNLNKDSIHLNFSNNNIKIINIQLLIILEWYLEKFNSRINIKNNPYSDYIFDFIDPNLVSKIIY